MVDNYIEINTHTLTDMYDLYINALDVNENHWYSYNYIQEVGKRLAQLVYQVPPDTERWESVLVSELLRIAKVNKKMKEFAFFHLEDLQFKGESQKTHAVICACVSNIPVFHSSQYLKRYIIMDFKKAKRALIFQDIREDEWKNNNLGVPHHWRMDVDLNRSFRQYRKMDMALGV